MAAAVFGWREWAALPALGAPAIRAKIDTGAWTGALHAVRLESFGASSVRFTLHPDPERPDLELACEAELAGRRPVRSSNGLVELRPVVRTPVLIGGLERRVELTLTDRGAMRHRLLLGRRALQAFGALVDPSRTHLHGGQAEP